MSGKLMPWREPLAADWNARTDALLKELRDLGDDARKPRPDLSGVLKRMSSMRLESSQQFRMQRLAKQALSRAEALPGFRKLRVLLASNRTMTFFANDLLAAAPARSLLIDAVDAGYDSVASLAFDPKRRSPEGKFDAVVVLLDLDALFQKINLLDEEQERRAIEHASDYLARIVAGLKERFQCHVILSTIADRPEYSLASSDGAIAGTRHRMIARLNEAVHAGGAARKWVVWDLAGLANRVGTNAWFDPVRFHVAKVPFAMEFGPLAADHLCRIFCAMFGKSARALVLDLDNTLWGGVIADDRLEGIKIGQGSAEGEAFLLFQELLLDLRDRGVALTVCSKNQDEIAREPFRNHPDMCIKESDIALFVCNFNDKASNVAETAKALSLGPESLVFVDDNPAERERVRSELPFVSVPEIGEEPAHYARILIDGGYFEHLHLTTEDLNRGEAYAARGLALEARASIGNYDEYLKALEMVIEIKPFDAVGRPRIEQLINKSNQFNLTTKRYPEADIARIEHDPGKIAWQIRLTDRFADHGMISVVIVDKAPDVWTIDTWLMSCRVLERGVEQTIMNKVFELAAAGGARIVRGTYCRTNRNGLVEHFFENMTFRATNSADADNDKQEYELRVEEYVPFAVQIQEKEIAAKEDLLTLAS